MLTMQVSPLDQGSRVSVFGGVSGAAGAQVTQMLAEIGKQRTPAGWYEKGTGIERYWDGAEWTEQTRRTVDLPIVVGPRMQHAQATAADGDDLEAD